MKGSSNAMSHYRTASAKPTLIPLPAEAYHVGIICALSKELAAMRAALDEEHEFSNVSDVTDSNVYVVGSIHGHNVVIACLPAGIYGTNAAATVAVHMLRTFRRIRFGLMVGIGGGVPADDSDIRLGDIVVNQPDQTHGGVVQYDLGKVHENGRFERKGYLGKPPIVLLTALSSLQSKPNTTIRHVTENISVILQQDDLADQGYAFPGTDKDILICSRCYPFQSSLLWWFLWLLLSWLNPLWSCSRCIRGKIPRPPNRTGSRVHYGTIVSGNSLIKDAAQRDQLRTDLGAKCIEMEAAGLMDSFPCLVVRGICDYADGHKNDVWQKYASVVAAAYAKEVLSVVSLTTVETSQYAVDATGHQMLELLGESNDLQRQTVDAYREQSEKLDSRYRTEHEQKCHQVFKTSPYEQFKNRNPARTEGTCRWVLEHDQYLSWHQSAHDDLLWVSADPGCGKSVLARFLVDHELRLTGQATVCHFFFKDNAEQNKLSLAVSSVLHQLFTDQPYLIKHAIQRWEENGTELSNEVEAMWEILLNSAMDRRARPIICVFDALDECMDGDRKQLIELLSKIQRQSPFRPPTNTLKVLATSRPYDNVQRWFETNLSNLHQIRLKGEDENHRIREEIDLVIQQRVGELATEFTLSKGHQIKLQQNLLQMKHRTYLWLYLAIDELRTNYRDSFDPDGEPLTTLPSSVEDAYEKILHKITTRQKPQARRVLMIILGAHRPLTVDEMSLALSTMTAYEKKQSFIGEPNTSHIEKQIRQWCGLFVFVQDSRFYLIHQTAKEFLLTEGLVNLAAGHWKSSIRRKEVEHQMTIICVTYLYLNGRDDEVGDGIKSRLRRSNEFHDYCANNWTSHLNDENVRDDPELLYQILELYNTDKSWFWLWFPGNFWKKGDRVPIPKVSSQHAIAMDGHALLLEHLYRTSTFELEKGDDYGRTALFWAASKGHDAVLDWLIRSQADVNAKTVFGRSALAEAATKGHETIVQRLLEEGAVADVQTKSGETALHLSAKSGHLQIVKKLLSTQISTDIPDKQGRTSLHAATYYGHLRIVDVLLAAGAAVDASDNEKETCLHMAASCGHLAILQKLLSAGADVQLTNTKGWTPLHTAVSNGRLSVMDELFVTGIDINAINVQKETALDVALNVGRSSAAQRLLAVGAWSYTTKQNRKIVRVKSGYLTD